MSKARSTHSSRGSIHEIGVGLSRDLLGRRLFRLSRRRGGSRPNLTPSNSKYPRPSNTKLGDPGRAFVICVFFLAVAGTLACSERPALSGYALQRATTCNGNLTQPGEPRTVRRVNGLTRFRPDLSPLPNVDVVLSDVASGRPKYMVRSDGEGRFDFGRVTPGVYELKTCLDGYASVDLRLSVSESRSASSVLNLDLSLDL
ncbi:MAG: carboxypeptidase-like regulatory domain-containing protein [Thermoanaerobaculia bacterium]